MDYSEFVAVIGAKKTPELTDFERVTVFANSADKDVLWAALGNGGIHPIYQSLVVQALHRRMIEQLEREQAQQRKLEDEARIDATRPTPSRKRSR